MATLFKISKHPTGQSQDDGVGRCRVRISSQLGHLPGADGGHQTPKGMGGIPKRLCRTRVGKTLGGKDEGRKRGGGMGLAPLMGGWGRKGVRMIGGAHPLSRDQQRWGETLEGLGGSEGNVASISPNNSSPREPAGVLGLKLSPSGTPLAKQEREHGKEGGGRKRGGGRALAPIRGRVGRKEVPTLGGAHPQSRDQQQWGEASGYHGIGGKQG